MDSIKKNVDENQNLPGRFFEGSQSFKIGR